ncbi:MAG: acetyl-CoA carboxylase biotin carboxylase subunit [Candidatus Brocadiia bacterium]|nr:acetyl-CoA carboxylase biotin carboxylase subunit [Planctomycetota bacterium]
MFSRILIANRGEVALRIIRACAELGVETVAIYSEGDANTKYLDYADDAVCIGPPPANESYLNIPRIIAAAEITNVDAIHPGYGFLSEEAEFAEICEESNIVFIGPTSEVMRKMGSKTTARTVAQEKKVPVLPGSEDPIESDDEAVAKAGEVGYPVMIKAASGGGGRGMRVAHNEITLRNMLALARSEAAQAFGNDAVYVEKVLERARHIEVQILGDGYGNIIHLGERDCSIQRRYQKLIEETPSPGISDDTRSSVAKSAVNLCKAVNYTGAGTVEFLVDRSGNYYFMEMNTRLQVEHPITEVVSGIDIVKEQIRVAAGERLPYQQKKLEFKGSAIECRINAEDPADDFRTSPGRITEFVPPGGPGIRLDTHVYSGYQVQPFYDSMVAKLICYGRNRLETLNILRRALEEFTVTGIKTTIPFYRDLIEHRGYASGNYDTHFVGEFLGGA